ncbi:AMP-binding protein, partial [uncultured Hymenobacter sp.]|uniref:AMP-binding protein n=1 Tax=uncultured Hymenobacter sp. TaxID=170016 RepID=UPI0035CA2452
FFSPDVSCGAGPRAAVVGPAAGRRWRWLARLTGRRLLTLPAERPAGAGPAPTAWPLQLVPAAQAALVSFSSGSTGGGQAHAVRRSHAVLLAQHAALKTAFPPRPGQRDFPLFLNVLLHNLAAGTTTIIPDLPWRSGWAGFAPARVLAQLRQERVTTLTGNVFYFQKLLAYLADHPATFPLVEGVGVGGSPVPESLLYELKTCFPAADCYVIYGCSEAEPIAVRRCGPAPADPRGGYCVGPVHPGLSLQLASPQPLWLPTVGGQHAAVETHALPFGRAADSGAGASAADARATSKSAAGEILVRGPHVARPEGAENGWLATGDFGYLDAAGQLWLVGRCAACGPTRSSTWRGPRPAARWPAPGPAPSSRLSTCSCRARRTWRPPFGLLWWRPLAPSCSARCTCAPSCPSMPGTSRKSATTCSASAISRYWPPPKAATHSS